MRRAAPAFPAIFRVGSHWDKRRGRRVREEPQRPYGIGSAVVALIFSMAKREVTFLSGTAAISRL